MACGTIHADTDLTAFAGLPFDHVLVGQTHRPFVRTAGAVTVVNVGSSGMPRDIGNLASCAVYDTGTREIEVLRRRFDADAVAADCAGHVDDSVLACLRRA